MLTLCQGQTPGLILSTVRALSELTATEGEDGLQAGYVDVDEPQSGHSPFEGRFLPKALKSWGKSLYIINIPASGPGEKDQEDTDFEDE